jgi:hypothetical protein
MKRRALAGLALALLAHASPAVAASRLDWVAVAAHQRGFVLQPSGRAFTPWGFNYDHDERDRLIEDYWDTEWAKVEEDFGEMKQLGANVVRVHLQFGRFMAGEDKPNGRALARLRRLVQLAERVGLYLDVTGLGCYHKAEVPAWYDALPEERRWAAQARFWRALARECRRSPAVFCYDLMNEPVAPAGPGRRDDWLGGAFAGKHYVQWIALETKGRARHAIARAWLRQLVAAIRAEDARHLITVGLVDWSLDRPGRLYSGFAPAEIAAELDFLSVHLYPERGQVAEAVETLRGFAVGKPVVVEETFPLRCSLAEFGEFLRASEASAAGWIGFYWGRTPAECRASGGLRDALMLGWLEFFQRRAPAPPK